MRMLALDGGDDQRRCRSGWALEGSDEEDDGIRWL